MRCQITGKNYFGNEVYSIQFYLAGLKRKAGQYIMAGPAGMGHLREYSLASAEDSREGRILFRRMPDGLVTPALAELKRGDFLDVRGPFGEFLLPSEHQKRKILFAATGTGIAPFTSFVGTCKSRSMTLDYTLLHGLRFAEENYLYDDFSAARVISCVSRELPSDGGFYGRITDYLRANPDFLNDFDMIYACGNSDMIYEVFSIARKYCFEREQLQAEIYF